MDLTEMVHDDEQRMRDFWYALQECWLAIYDCALPVVAAIDGQGPLP